jgi:hypothetical protein
MAHTKPREQRTEDPPVPRRPEADNSAPITDGPLRPQRSAATVERREQGAVASPGSRPLWSARIADEPVPSPAVAPAGSSPNAQFACPVPFPQHCRFHADHQIRPRGARPPAGATPQPDRTSHVAAPLPAPVPAVCASRTRPGERSPRRGRPRALLGQLVRPMLGWASTRADPRHHLDHLSPARPAALEPARTTGATPPTRDSSRPRTRPRQTELAGRGRSGRRALRGGGDSRFTWNR